MFVNACDVSTVSYPGLLPSVALHGSLPGLLGYNLTLFFFSTAEPVVAVFGRYERDVHRRGLPGCHR